MNRRGFLASALAAPLAAIMGWKWKRTLPRFDRIWPMIDDHEARFSCELPPADRWPIGVYEYRDYRTGETTYSASRGLVSGKDTFGQEGT